MNKASNNPQDNKESDLTISTLNIKENIVRPEDKQKVHHYEYLKSLASKDAMEEENRLNEKYFQKRKNQNAPAVLGPPSGYRAETFRRIH